MFAAGFKAYMGYRLAEALLGVGVAVVIIIILVVALLLKERHNGRKS